MAFLLQIGDEVFPEQTSELVLSRSGREVSSLVMCPVALYTCMVDAQVGQEGIGETHQMQVCNCRSIRAILVLDEPQQLLDVFHPLFDGPAPVVRLDQLAAESSGALVTSPRIFLAVPFREKTTWRRPRWPTVIQPAST